MGTGYVGLTSGVCLASVGHEVECIDILPNKVAAINEGNVPFFEPGLEQILRKELESGRFRASIELVPAIAGSQVSFIAVGTPEDGGRPDLADLEAAGIAIGKALSGANGRHTVCVKSTVPPGTTAGTVKSLLEQASGTPAGEFGLAANPEFLREGFAIEDFMDPDRIVIGAWDEPSADDIEAVYEVFDCPKVRMTLTNAEMTKYTSNAFFASLISFSNEIAAVCEGLPDADVEAVLSAVALDRRLTPVIDGTRMEPGMLSYLAAGSGFGGSCLPKDLNAFRVIAREIGIDPRILDAVARVNEERPRKLVEMARHALGGLKGRTLTVLGVAFKPGTDDVRSSPAIELIDALVAEGAEVRILDPLVEKVKTAAGWMSSAPHSHEALQDADGAILITAWPEFGSWPWAKLVRIMRTPIVIDGRNALRDVEWPEGVRYIPIGRQSETEGAQHVP